MEPGKEKPEFIIIGKKGAIVKKYYNYDIAAEFSKADIMNMTEISHSFLLNQEL